MHAAFCPKNDAADRRSNGRQVSIKRDNNITAICLGLARTESLESDDNADHQMRAESAGRQPGFLLPQTAQ
jgi:hypothetical protein